MRYSEMTGIEKKELLAKYKITAKKTLYYPKSVGYNLFRQYTVIDFEVKSSCSGSDVLILYVEGIDTSVNVLSSYFAEMQSAKGFPQAIDKPKESEDIQIALF